MRIVHLILGLTLCGLLAAAGLLGAWRWYRVETSRAFWPLLRAGQVALAVEVVLGGILYLQGQRGGHLHVLYGTLPLLVSFAAEQLRIASAEAVLEQRGLEDAQAVGRLAADEQRSVAVAILRRELGVMALAALVALGLVVRAAYIGLS